MINIFQSQFAPDDKSLVFLNQLFGNMNGIIYNPEASSGAAVTTINILSVMFKTFNTVILAVAVLIVVYITIVGVMSTAHEGEFIKKYHGLWTPIRMVLGIAALVPTGSGYSAIQMLLMWIVVQGIGAADLLWNTVINYTSITGNVTSQITLPTTGTQATMQSLFNALTCDATTRMTTANPGGAGANGAYYCADPNNKCTANPFIATSSGTYNMGAQTGICGTLSYCVPDTVCTSDPNNPTTTGPNSINCAVCRAQGPALDAIVNTFSGIATIFAKADYSYRDFYYNSASGKASDGADWSWINNYCSANNIGQNACCVPSKSPNAVNNGRNCSGSFINPDSANNGLSAPNEVVQNLYWPYGLQPKTGNINFINVAVTYYMSQMSDAVSTNIVSQSAPTSGPFVNAQKTGWIYAGAYYYTIASGTKSQLSASMPLFSVTSSAPSNFNYRNNYTAAQNLLTLLPNASKTENETNNSNNAPNASSSGGCGLPTPMCPLMSPITSMLGDVSNALNLNNVSQASNGVDTNNPIGLTGGGMNPLVKMAIAGQVILYSVQLTYPLLLAINFGLGTALGINGWVFGTGLQDPMVYGALFLFLLFAPLVMMLLGFLIVIGGLLGIYLPLVPLVIFTLGVLGWFISIIEAMVAGPIVALGILTPNAQGHELLGKAEAGVQIIFNIFLRPSLMIFGLMAAMLLASVILSVINYAFWHVFFMSMGVANVDNIIAWVILVFAYIALVVVALNKCFGLIGVLPERVMGWIGGRGEHGFEGEGLGEVRSQTGEGARRGEQATGEAKNAGREGAQSYEKNKGKSKSPTVKPLE